MFSFLTEVNGIKVLDGCARCISENGWCRDAAKLVNAESVLAEPMSYMDKPLNFPVKCLKDWWGKNYSCCSECGVAFYQELYETHCRNCGVSLEPDEDSVLDTDYLIYDTYTDEVVIMEGCKECVKKHGKCDNIKSCAKNYPLVYTDVFGSLPQGFPLPAYCVYTIDGCQRYCKDCRQATTEEIDICPLCGGDMREFF